MLLYLFNYGASVLVDKQIFSDAMAMNSFCRKLQPCRKLLRNSRGSVLGQVGPIVHLLLICVTGKGHTVVNVRSPAMQIRPQCSVF